MQIIPVLDILNSQVVHGIKGERDKYIPIQSVLTVSSEPFEVAKAFKHHFRISELYIADLDSIMHQQSNFSYIETLITQIHLNIMLDAGLDETKPIIELLKKGINKIIIGTESLRSLSKLEEILSIISPKSLILSLDLKQGRILSKAKDLLSQSPIAVVHQFENLGIQEIIVLELTKVGSESGVMTTILQDILQETSIPIITGGGVRNIQDLKILKDAGISGVLIATALHKGTITPQDLTLL
ncbi:MAG: HisA/HisF-related TIM barrel protein [Promethearchaeota archaeon]